MAGSAITLKIPTRDDLLKMYPRAMAAAADRAAAIVKARTAAGTSSTGAAFAPYTTDYRLKRVASGRKGTPVDLTVSGALLGGLKRLRVEPGGKRAWIGWEGQHRGYRLKASGVRGFVSDIETKRTVRKHALKRTIGGKPVASVPYAVLVPALHRKRPFFAITRPEELADLVSTFQRVLDEETRRYNARNGRR